MTREPHARARPRGVVAAAVAAVLASVGVLLGALALRDDDPPTVPRVETSYREDRPAARLAARRACGYVDDAIAAIDRDASGADVLRLLAQAEAAATEAYNRDVRWVRLLSAAKALTAALHDDDPQAAGVGLTTAKEECAVARASQ